MRSFEALKKNVILLLAGALALGAGFYFGLSSRLSDPDPQAESVLAALPLHDLQGRARQISEWQTKPLILNFWATWCAPCREEMPLLDRWQQDHADKAQVLGIALDSAENVLKFRDHAAIRFPLLLGGAELLEAMKSFGNAAGGLPFSLFLDREGRIVGSHVGAMTEADLAQALALMQQGFGAQK